MYVCKGVGVIRNLKEIIIREVYEHLDILKKELIASIKKFGFIDPVNPNKFYYTYYQDNDHKHKSYLWKSCLQYNCAKVIDTPVQSPDINPFRNLWIQQIKTNGEGSLKKSGENIPSEYDTPKLI